MASQLIAHVAAWYIPTGQPLVNDMDGLTTVSYTHLTLPTT